MIKKLAFLLLLNLLIINSSFAYDLKDRPDWSVDDLQSNIKDYGFKIVDTNIANTDSNVIEIITLEKKEWILKCRVRYTYQQIYTFCDFP